MSRDEGRMRTAEEMDRMAAYCFAEAMREIATAKVCRANGVRLYTTYFHINQARGSNWQGLQWRRWRREYYPVAQIRQLTIFGEEAAA